MDAPPPRRDPLYGPCPPAIEPPPHLQSPETQQSRSPAGRRWHPPRSSWDDAPLPCNAPDQHLCGRCLCSNRSDGKHTLCQRNSPSAHASGAPHGPGSWPERRPRHPEPQGVRSSQKQSTRYCPAGAQAPCSAVPPSPDPPVSTTHPKDLRGYLHSILAFLCSCRSSLLLPTSPALFIRSTRRSCRPPSKSSSNHAAKASRAAPSPRTRAPKQITLPSL